MTDLKPGYVRVFQCEACGMVFDASSEEASALGHIAVVRDEHGDPEPAQCGPITERILADPDVVRREIMVTVFGLLYEFSVEIDPGLDGMLRALAGPKEGE